MNQMLCAAITTFGSGGFTPGTPVSTHTFLENKREKKDKTYNLEIKIKENNRKRK